MFVTTVLYIISAASMMFQSLFLLIKPGKFKIQQLALLCSLFSFSLLAEGNSDLLSYVFTSAQRLCFPTRCFVPVI